jgi:cytidylate kinase
MSARTVVVISRQLGSGGSVIGRAIAQRLNIRYADHEIMHQAAQTLGVPDEDAAPLEERVQGVWENLMPLFWVPISGPAMPGIPPVTGSALFDVESSIIQALASREDVVIVGRGAAHLLKQQPGVISIFVHAAEAVRVERMAATIATDQATAADAVRRSDRDRAAFHRSLSQRDWTDASQYDLCVNTSALGIEIVTDTVVELVARVRERRAAR